MESTDLLKQITELSHQFGTTDYVRGGGGNTSVKTEDTLWVKPSGTTLATLIPESFVAMDRQKLSTLFDIQPPAEPAAREELVKEKMEQAVCPDTPGRASVEAPLHDSLSARFVVHTHPAVVNGMTCSKNGKQICNELFPTALWQDYIDPGYTLCIQVRREIQNYAKQYGHEPEVIFLKNHGLFIAADEPQQMQAIYNEVMERLKYLYRRANISLTLPVASTPSSETVASAKQMILDAMPDNHLSVAAGGMFDYADGPISPDHIVYSKSYPFVGEPTTQGIEAFQAQYGYLPQLVVFDEMVFGVAATDKKASLALEFALDGALVKQLAQAFGGINYMTDQARLFIENWEVESYRSKQL